MTVGWSYDWECELRARPGLCGRVWFEARETPAAVGGMRFECALPDIGAEALAEALQEWRRDQGEGWGTDPCGDEIIITVMRGRFKMSVQEAESLVTGIRRAVAWPEGHP